MRNRRKLGHLSTEAEFLTGFGFLQEPVNPHFISLRQLAHGPYLQELLGQSSSLAAMIVWANGFKQINSGSQH